MGSSVLSIIEKASFLKNISRLTFSQKISLLFLIASLTAFSAGKLSPLVVLILITALCAGVFIIALSSIILHCSRNWIPLYLILLFLATGYALYQYLPPPYPCGKSVTVLMKLTSYPDVRRGTFRYTSRILHLSDGEAYSTVSHPEEDASGKSLGGEQGIMGLIPAGTWTVFGRVLSNLPSSDMKPARGDRVLVQGLFLELPYEKRSEYAKYLRSIGIDALFEGYSSSIKAQKSPAVFSPVSLANQMRLWVARVNKRLLPVPHSDFATALLTGRRRSLPSYLTEYFRRSGTIHILAVSGLHVGFLSIFFLFLLRIFRLNKNLTYVFLCVFIIFFMIFIGESSSVRRASLMALCGIACHLFDRDRDYLNALAVSFSILWLINPLALQNPGFLLSFCATFGLLLIVPRLYEVLHKIMPSFFAASLSTSLAVQLYIFPVMVSFFQNFAYVNIIANIPIVSLTGVSLALEVVTLVFYPLALPLAVITAEVNTVVIAMIVRCARLFARVPPLMINNFPQQCIPFYLIAVTVGVLFILKRTEAVKDKNISETGR